MGPSKNITIDINKYISKRLLEYGMVLDPKDHRELLACYVRNALISSDGDSFIYHMENDPYCPRNYYPIESAMRTEQLEADKFVFNAIKPILDCQVNINRY